MKRKVIILVVWLLTFMYLLGGIIVFGETVPSDSDQNQAAIVSSTVDLADMSPQPAHTPDISGTSSPTNNPFDPMSSGEVVPLDTPPPSVTPFVGETASPEATSTVSEISSTLSPSAAPTTTPFLKGYVAVSAGAWFYTTRFTDVAKRSFQTEKDVFGYTFDVRANRQGEIWAEVGFATRHGEQWEMRVGYIPVTQLRIIGEQPDPEWVSQSSSVPGAYYLINGKADRPLPPASLKIAPQPTPAAASSAPEENTPCPTATEITETPSAAQNASETQLSEEMLSAWPADTPSPWPTSSPDHAQILHASANGDGSAIIPAVPEVQKERPDPEGSASIATSSDLTSASKKVWIEVERPESGLYRGDEVILRAKAEGFENVSFFQWEYRPSQEEDWIIYPLTEDKSHDTITLEVNSENVSWQWRVIAK